MLALRSYSSCLAVFERCKASASDAEFSNLSSSTQSIHAFPVAIRFLSMVKRGIAGVYHCVSSNYLQMCFDEYTFRLNHRLDVTPLFGCVFVRLCGVSAD